MTLTERIAVLQRVADAVQSVLAALLPLSADDRRAVLADVMAELERPPVNNPLPVIEAPPPGKPTPRPKREPTTDGAAGRRERVLRLLAANEDGLKAGEIAGKLGESESSVFAALRHEWFEKADPSYGRSPWILSEAGEAEAKRLATP